ncbi:hypothetical protein HKCCE4037_03600 [Rhodobacterales bacterium HKCCE4037]|nr:hypothetical protein [Rhodobacterales bacterium HKCCE4037]
MAAMLHFGVSCLSCSAQVLDAETDGEPISGISCLLFLAPGGPRQTCGGDGQFSLEEYAVWNNATIRLTSVLSYDDIAVVYVSELVSVELGEFDGEVSDVFTGASALIAGPSLNICAEDSGEVFLLNPSLPIEAYELDLRDDRLGLRMNLGRPLSERGQVLLVQEGRAALVTGIQALAGDIQIISFSAFGVACSE